MNLRIFSILVIGFLLSGCVSPENSAGYVDSEEDLPQNVSFESPTYFQDQDGDVSDLSGIVEGERTLLLWVGASCRGCHDWTNMIREGIENGSISDISVVSIHRWSAFEDENQTLSRYVGDNSENPSIWPVMLPDENTRVINLDTGYLTTTGLYEAFDDPSTPTLQIYHEDGSVESLQHSYWADWDELSNFAEVLKMDL